MAVALSFDLAQDRRIKGTRRDPYYLNAVDFGEGMRLK